MTGISPEAQAIADRIRLGKLTIEDDDAICEAQDDAREAAGRAARAEERRRMRVEADARIHKEGSDAGFWERVKVSDTAPIHGGTDYVRCDFKFTVGTEDFYCCRPIHRTGRHAKCDGVKIRAVEGGDWIYTYSDGHGKLVKVSD